MDSIKNSLNIISKIKIKTFGKFELWVDDVPVYFRNKKAKELLALLVDRNGEVLEDADGYAILLGVDSFSADTRITYEKLKKQLQVILYKNGISDLLVKSRGKSCINKERVSDCDYFQVQDKNINNIIFYNGRYMEEYDWNKKNRKKLEQMEKQYIQRY